MNRLIPRIRREYEEWPRLSLTLRQAIRLWDADRHVCAAALATLVRTGFLMLREDQRFVRREEDVTHRVPRGAVIACSR